jgi:hypothetical protein
LEIVLIRFGEATDLKGLKKWHFDKTIRATNDVQRVKNLLIFNTIQLNERFRSRKKISIRDIIMIYPIS